MESGIFKNTSFSLGRMILAPTRNLEAADDASTPGKKAKVTWFDSDTTSTTEGRLDLMPHHIAFISGLFFNSYTVERDVSLP